MNPFEINDNELYWLAGLLEGEGCFGLYKGRRHKTPVPFVVVKMTDRDIIEKVSRIFNAKVFERPKLPYKAMWETEVRGKLALSWMQKLKPLMGMRRQERIGFLLQQGYQPMSVHERAAKGGQAMRAKSFIRLNKYNSNLFEQRAQL